MTDVATGNDAERVMDERDANVLRDLHKYGFKRVADDYDIEPTKVLAILLTSLDNQTLRYAVEEIVT